MSYKYDIELDEYLIEGASYNRLLEEYKKYGSLTIGVDFDGTLHDYHKNGASHEMVRQLVRDLKEIGCKIVIWTAYKDLVFVESFCNQHKIPQNGINKGSIPLPWDSKKPFFSALLDDRAGLLQVFQELSLLVRTVKNEKLFNKSNS
ncbi:MAG: hypothetical protein ACEQSQ_06130 [Candidatus Paceibacteria bacterium]